MFKTLTLAAALLATAGTVHAAPLGMAQVEKKLRDAGYSRIHEIEKDDGLWEADVTRDDGRFREVYVDPKTGEIFDEFDGRAQLDVDQLLAKASAQGLRDIRKLERDGAVWKLDAVDARNRKVEVRMSGHDGRILTTEREGWLD